MSNIKLPWKEKKNFQIDQLHSLCSYLGSFPPQLANFFISNFSCENDLIYDLFSGRGTTILEARNLKRKSIGTDLNPIALSLSRAKSHKINLESVISRINSLENDYDEPLFMPESKAQPDEIQLIFHYRTLSQLCYLKILLLDSDDPVDEFIIGLTLGIMHGGKRRDGTSNYLSISMPNTFSMSPDYVRKYVQVNQLNRNYKNVFDQLKNRASLLLKNYLSHNIESDIYEIDAKKLSKSKNLKEHIGKVNLVLTSPPYLSVVNYAKQNWIRSWFLNADPEIVSEKLDDNLNIQEWIEFSSDYIKELKKVIAKDGIGIFVIGDVAKQKGNLVPLAREFCKIIEDKKLFKNIWVISDYIDEKTTKIWGDTMGNATSVDRIVIVSDINPFESKKFFNHNHNLTYDMIKNSTKKYLGKS